MATIRLRESTHKTLKSLAKMTGKPLQDVLEEALEEKTRRVYLEGLNADYAALKKDTRAWKALRAEVGDWDATLKDGLEEE